MKRFFRDKPVYGMAVSVLLGATLTACSSTGASGLSAEAYEENLKKAGSGVISRNTTDVSAQNYSVEASAYIAEKMQGVLLSENYSANDVSDATQQLHWLYPARVILQCANTVTSVNPKYVAKVENAFKEACPETLRLVESKNYLGLLKSYEYRTSEKGLFAIVQDNGDEVYEAFFINVNSENGSSIYDFVGGAYLSEDGPGILSVKWSDGSVDAARFYDDGTVAFECQDHLKVFVSRADCELAQDFDTMSTGLRQQVNASEIQWQDQDSMANDLGNILTIKFDSFSTGRVDFYQFKSFSIGQSGGMFPSGTYGVRDLGFGLLKIVNQSNRQPSLGFFVKDYSGHEAVVSFWADGDWIDFYVPKK